MAKSIVQQFQIDPVHSNIGFKIRHMMVAKVNGRFKDYKASLTLEKDSFSTAQLNFIAQTASIDTNDKERDDHLRSPDFFNAKRYREITFDSSSITKIQGNHYYVEGQLTMNGFSNPIKLHTEYSGVLKDPKGVERIALSMSARIDRLMWHMKWNRPLESGGILVSKEVQLIIDCEFIPRQEE